MLTETKINLLLLEFAPRLNSLYKASPLYDVFSIIASNAMNLKDFERKTIMETFLIHTRKTIKPLVQLNVLNQKVTEDFMDLYDQYYNRYSFVSEIVFYLNPTTLDYFYRNYKDVRKDYITLFLFPYVLLTSLVNQNEERLLKILDYLDKAMVNECDNKTFDSFYNLNNILEYYDRVFEELRELDHCFDIAFKGMEYKVLLPYIPLLKQFNIANILNHKL